MRVPVLFGSTLCCLFVTGSMLQARTVPIKAQSHSQPATTFVSTRADVTPITAASRPEAAVLLADNQTTGKNPGHAFFSVAPGRTNVIMTPVPVAGGGGKRRHVPPLIQKRPPVAPRS